MKTFPRKRQRIHRVTHLLCWVMWCAVGAEEVHAFKCCWDHQFSADTEEECAQHHCSVHGAADSCDFLGVGDSSDATGGDATGGGSSAPQQLSASEAALLSAIEPLVYQMGYELGKSLVGPSPAEKAAEAARRRGITSELQREADALEEERTRQLESDTTDLLGQMKGVEFAELQPQALGTSRRLDFQSYAQRMTDTRDVLEDLRQRVAVGKEDKELLDWCLLNIPLYPTQPIQPIPDEQYQTMLEAYWRRKAAWDTRCKVGTEASEAGATSTGSLPFKPLSPPPVPASGIRGIEPKSWAACLNDYTRNVRGCESGDHLNEKMACINTQIQEWQQCITRSD